MPGPLPIIFSEDPGIDKQERRGKSRERADMLKILHRARLHRAVAQQLCRWWTLGDEWLR
jgi:hypothetical protein